MPEHEPSDQHDSRFLDLLRKAGTVEIASVGFGPAREQTSPYHPLVLVAYLERAEATLCQAAADAGASALFVPSVDAKLASQCSVPLLVLPADGQRVTGATAAAWRQAGADAVALRPVDAAVDCFAPEQPAPLVVINHGTDPADVRILASLPAAAWVLRIRTDDAPLTAVHLAWVTAVTGAVRGPSVVLTNAIEPQALGALTVAGCTGIAIACGPESTPASIGAQLAPLRSTVEQLEPHIRQHAHERTGRTPVVIPFRGTHE